MEEEQCWVPLELTERVVWEQAGAVLSQSSAKALLPTRNCSRGWWSYPALIKGFAISMCMEGERPVDRYCCWLNIISAHARERAGASTGVNSLSFHLSTNTEECQEDRLLLNPRFVFVLAQEAGDAGK